MMQFGIKEAKAAFFDRRAVINDVDKKTRRALSSIGAYIRRVARSSMRWTSKKGDYSKPGKPPKAHRGKGMLKRFLFFAWDNSTRSMVVGPARLGGMTGEIPRTLEDGGNIQNRRGRQTVTMHYEARPYMGPAVDKSKPIMPQKWRQSINRG